MTTQPKRMLVHTYTNDMWSTKEYPSIRAMQRDLRKNGITFTDADYFALGNDSVVITGKDSVMEIEEAIERDGDLWFNGKRYITAKNYMDKTGKTWRQVHYAYDSGKIPGMKVGRRGYLYLLWEVE